MLTDDAIRSKMQEVNPAERRAARTFAPRRSGLGICLALGVFSLLGCGSHPVALPAMADALRPMPPTAVVAVRQTQRFIANGPAGDALAVIWSVTGEGCRGQACGQVDTQGIYRAPAILPRPAVVILNAALVSDRTRTLTTRIHLTAKISVTVAPNQIQIPTAAAEQFSAAVVGTGNQFVTWSLSGPGCVGMQCGTITGAGYYTAPASPPTPPTVYVKATSFADPTVSGIATAQVVKPSPIVVTLNPTALVLSAGGQQQFSAVVTGSHDTAVVWTVAGAGCFAYNCGIISTSGLYSAPSTIPSPPSVTVTAYAHADPTKHASSVVTLATPVTVKVSPGLVQVLPGRQQQFTAAVGGTSNTSVSWSVSGSGCSGTACGTITSGGMFTAPTSLPSAPSVIVKAISMADPSKSASAVVTFTSTISVSVSPLSIHVAPKAQQQFNAVVSGTTNQVVIWNLSGKGCSGLACGQISGTGLYTAPSAVPSPNAVTVTATALADSSKSGAATAYVGAGSPINVTTSPASASVLVAHSQQFAATVTGTTNTTVIWSLAGIGCSGQTCGLISQSGLYTAPSVTPVPSSVTVTATSQADWTRSGFSTVTISPNITISVAPSAIQLTTGQQTQFKAIVAGSTNTTVTWTLSGTGCSGSSCGTLSQGGLYTAPAQVTSTLKVAVKATAQADPSKSATAAVTVTPPIEVTVSPQTAQVVINGQQQFVATVTGASSKTAVNWSLSGKGCPSGCGTINNVGLYTAPSAVTNSPVTVIATSQADGTSFGTADLLVIPSNAIKLKGHYAFLFHGTDSTGLYQAAGSFVADGQGGITSGTEDINRTSGPVTNLSFLGTYSVGGDNRGVLTISNSLGKFSYAFALTSNANVSRFIEIDSSGIRGAGVMERQDTSAFSPSALTGGYSVNLTGVDSSGARIGALASLYPSGSGVISGSSLDVNDGGNSLPTFVNFSGNYTVMPTGRGTLLLNLPGFAGGTLNFVMYVVSANEFFLLSSDRLGTNPLFSGSALLQSGAPFNGTIFSGNSAFYETGLSNGVPDVSVGRLNYDGHGTVAVQFDENAGGTVVMGGLMTGAYAVSLNGRTVLNLFNQQTHQQYLATMYAISQNTAFIMDATGSVRSGYLENQTVTPPFGSADLAGSYAFGAASPLGAANLVSGAALFDGSGGVQGNEDQALTSGIQLNQPLGGTYSVSQVSDNGRAVILLTHPQTETIATWLATYSRAYGIPADASETEPTVLIFEQ